MTLLNSNQQIEVSQQNRMPVNDSGSDAITSVSAEALTFQYYNASGVLTTDAGQAVGTVVVIKLANNNILNQAGDVIGNPNDSSFAFGTGTILVTARLRAFPYLTAEKYSTAAGATKATQICTGFMNGDWCIDHENGIIYGKKATTGTSDTGSYKVLKSSSSVSSTTVSSTVPPTPPSTSTNSYTPFSNLGANATLNVKATPGNVFSVKCHNLNGAARYFQLHNTATTPGGGAVPAFTTLIPANSEVLIGTDYFGEGGLNFSTGIAFAFSTTEATYTAGTAADQMSFVNYK